MHIYRGLQELTYAPRGAALVLGSFDGVHVGHAALIAAARARQNPVGVVTFAPHPRLLTQPWLEPLLLTSSQQKYTALSALHVDFCVELQFTRDFASISAEDFVSEILIRRLGAAHIISGYNYRFGASRRGDVGLLKQLGAQFGVSVESLGPVLDREGEPYSSTRIRNRLRAGDFAGAASLLGRPWKITVRLQQEPHMQSMRGHFHFGEYLKPLPGRHQVRVRSEDGSNVDAPLVVSRENHTGVLELQTQWLGKSHGELELEFLESVIPAAMPRWHSDMEAERACHI